MVITTFTENIDRLNDWATGKTLKVMFTKGEYAPADTCVFLSDLVPATNEVTGTGWARLSLTNPSRTVDHDNNKILFTTDDVNITPSAGADTATGVVIFDDTGDDATSRVFVFTDKDCPYTPNGRQLDLNFANGIFEVT